MKRINRIREKVYEYRTNFTKDLALLIAQASWRDTDTISANYPFGEGIANVFQIMKNICIREGLIVESVDNYAFHATLERKSPVTIALASHLDTVPIYEESQWFSPPLTLSEREGIFYGLGVNDDKGPALACLYTIKIIKELNLIPLNSLRLIFGGAEETTWECMQEYRKIFSDPDFVIVSDGNFPLVFVEKGDLQIKITLPLLGLRYIKSTVDFGILCQDLHVEYQEGRQTFQVEQIPSRHPYRGRDALNLWADSQKGLVFDFIKKWDDGHGVAWNLVYKKEDIVSNCSNTFALIGAEGKNNKLILYGDIRYMTLDDKNNILNTLNRDIEAIEGSIEIIRERVLIHEPKESPLIQSLLTSYQNVTGDNKSKPLVMGAMSYARAFKKAIAFGPCFPNYNPHSHKANESMPVYDLLESIVIYIESIIQLQENIFNKGDINE